MMVVGRKEEAVQNEKNTDFIRDKVRALKDTRKHI